MPCIKSQYIDVEFGNGKKYNIIPALQNGYINIGDLDKFDIEYLFYLLQTINIISNTHKRYWISEYMPISLKIHSINEQKKIVNKINRMFTILNSMSNSI